MLLFIEFNIILKEKEIINCIFTVNRDNNFKILYS